VRDLGVAEERVDVIPHGVGKEFQPRADQCGVLATRAQFGLGTYPYVLYVGNFNPHKNVPKLIAAFGAALDQDGSSQVRLVLAGSTSTKGDAVEREIKTRRLDDRVLQLGRVPADDLPLLMSGASAVACVSLYEGFGLTALEAMASGTPVVASNRSSLPEVVGDAGLLVDPDSERDIAAALRRILTDPALASALRVKGIHRAAKFSWERTASLTMQTYASAAQECWR
jgi:glycosyltransferase involved in cell wall biosynthesis